MTVSEIHFNSTVVLVDNPPFTREGMRELWERSNKSILERGGTMKDKYDKIIFIKNNLERPYNSQELKYWQGDNQYCLMGLFKNKCLSKDDVFFVIISNERGGDGKVEGYNGVSYSIMYINR